MIKPRQFAEYVGFTEDEVRTLCHDYGRDYSQPRERLSRSGAGAIRMLSEGTAEIFFWWESVMTKTRQRGREGTSAG
ncbi:MAG: hypothetical protein K2N95_06720 [Lachnospiraceae bacterium]|nr:hypothetical protein [Lachnospiraceae bacterium]